MSITEKKQSSKHSLNRPSIQFTVQIKFYGTKPSLDNKCIQGDFKKRKRHPAEKYNMRGNTEEIEQVY